MAIVVPIVSTWDPKGVNQASKSIGAAQGPLGKLSGAFGNLLTPGKLAFAGLGTAALGWIGEAEAGAAATAKLGNVMASMGDKSGALTARMEDYASSLSSAIAVDDDQVKAVQTKLATFSSLSSQLGVTSGMMDRATAAAFDLGAAGFGTAESNAAALGKALENPSKGIASLAKSGVTFTEAEKKKIAALQESGDLLGAQTIVMQAVEKQVKGTAEAGVTNADKMKTAFGNLAEDAGGLLLPAFEGITNFVTTKLVPGIKGFIDFIKTGDLSGLAKTIGLKPDSGLLQFLDQLRDVAIKVGTFIKDTLVPALKDFATNIVIPALGATVGFIKEYSGYIVPLAAGVLAVAAAVKIWNTALSIGQGVVKAYTAVQAALNVVMSLNPFALVVLAVIALVAIFVVAWKNSETFRDVIKGVWEAIKTGVTAAVNFVKTIVTTVFNAIKTVVSTVWNAIKTVILVVWTAIKTYVTTYINIVKTVVTTVFNAVKTTVTTIWDGIKGAIKTVWDFIRRIFDGAKTAVQPFIDAFLKIKDKITGFMETIREKVQGMWDKVKGILDSVGGALSKIPFVGKFFKGLSIEETVSFLPGAEIVPTRKSQERPVVINISGAVDQEGTARTLSALLDNYDLRHARVPVGRAVAW